MGFRSFSLSARRIGRLAAKTRNYAMPAKIKLAQVAAVAVSVLSIGLAAAGSAAAANRSVLVINDTNHVMTNLYASNTSDPNYHGDLLGRDVLSPGESVVINFTDGAGACFFDVRGDFNDSTYVQRHSVNVCSDYRLIFNGD
jgi:hypothetical protein